MATFFMVQKWWDLQQENLEEEYKTTLFEIQANLK